TRAAQGVFGGLRRPTARNQNRKVLAIGSGRPEQMKVCTTSLVVLPKPLVLLQIIDWPRIRIPLVEGLDRGCYSECSRGPLAWRLVHESLSDPDPEFECAIRPDAASDDAAELQAEARGARWPRGVRGHLFLSGRRTTRPSRGASPPAPLPSPG